MAKTTETKTGQQNKQDTEDKAGPDPLAVAQQEIDQLKKELAEQTAANQAALEELQQSSTLEVEKAQAALEDQQVLIVQLEQENAQLGGAAIAAEKKAKELQDLPSRAEILKNRDQTLQQKYKAKRLPVLENKALDVRKAHERVNLAWPEDSEREPPQVQAKNYIVITKDGNATRVTNCADEADAKRVYYAKHKLDPSKTPLRVIRDAA